MTTEALPALIVTPPGRYRHYKGGLYEVVGTARHSETLEPMTIYRALYGEQGLWVRPAGMFAERVDATGALIASESQLGAATGPERSQLRFTKIEADLPKN